MDALPASPLPPPLFHYLLWQMQFFPPSVEPWCFTATKWLQIHVHTWNYWASLPGTGTGSRGARASMGNDSKWAQRDQTHMQTESSKRCKATTKRHKQTTKITQSDCKPQKDHKTTQTGQRTGFISILTKRLFVEFCKDQVLTDLNGNWHEGVCTKTHDSKIS